VSGDPENLRILLGNLVDNAIRCTPPGGRIDLAARHQRPGAVLEVRDTGPGIPPEERARVLDRFYRGANPGGGGSGLGLSIVQRIAQQHGATLMLDPGKRGIGLSARVHFPRSESGDGEDQP
jgi:two-component system OmpR family sensor kinase